MLSQKREAAEVGRRQVGVRVAVLEVIIGDRAQSV